MYVPGWVFLVALFFLIVTVQWLRIWIKELQSKVEKLKSIVRKFPGGNEALGNEGLNSD